MPKKIFIIAAFFLFLTDFNPALPTESQSVVYAQNELAQSSKKANKNDVLGRWVMFYQILSPPIKNDSPFFSAFQIFDFLDDNFLKTVTSTKALTDEEINVYLEKMPKRVRFTFMADGLLVIARSKRDIDNIVISIITKNMQSPLRAGEPMLQKGDLILTYLTPDKKPYMQRFLRRK